MVDERGHLDGRSSHGNTQSHNKKEGHMTEQKKLSFSDLR